MPGDKIPETAHTYVKIMTGRAAGRVGWIPGTIESRKAQGITKAFVYPDLVTYTVDNLTEITKAEHDLLCVVSRNS